MGFESIFFDHAEVGVSDRVVVFDKFVEFLQAGFFKPIHEVLNFFDLMRSEINLADNLSIFDGLNLLFDVGSV